MEMTESFQTTVSAEKILEKLKAESDARFAPHGSDEYFLTVQHTLLPLIIIGLVTNVFNAMIFTRAELRHWSTSVYILAISFADTFHLIVNLSFDYIPTMFLDPDKYNNTDFCSWRLYMVLSTRYWSNWLVVCITFERLIVLTLPLKAHLICTATKARVAIVLVAGIAFSSNLGPLFTNITIDKGGRRICMDDPHREELAKITGWVEALVNTINVMLVFTLNIALVVVIKKKKFIQNNADTKKQEQERRLGIMMLGIGVLYLVFELPIAFASLISSVFGANSKSFPLYIYTCTVFSTVSHSSNFFIYVVSGKRFREIFLNMWRCSSDESKRNSSSNVVTDTSSCGASDTGNQQKKH